MLAGYGQRLGRAPVYEITKLTLVKMRITSSLAATMPLTCWEGQCGFLPITFLSEPQRISNFAMNHHSAHDRQAAPEALVQRHDAGFSTHLDCTAVEPENPRRRAGGRFQRGL